MQNGLTESTQTQPGLDMAFKSGDAESYNNVADYFDKYTEQFTTHLPGPMLDLAEVPEDAKILDIGTGTGIVALSAVDLVGGQSEIVGIDLSDGMLRVAQEKAVERGFSDRVQFLKMDAENLEFEDASFDAALSLYALRHFPNPEQSVAEIYRVLKPGGSVVVAVGSRPAIFSADGVIAAIRLAGSTVRRATGRELSACEFLDSLVEKHIPREQGSEIAEWVGHQHGFSGSIKDLLADAGFRSIESTWRGQYSTVQSPEEFWEIQMTFSSLARKRLATAQGAVLARIRSEFLSESEAVLRRNGRLVYQTGAAIVRGVKPKD